MTGNIYYTLAMDTPDAIIQAVQNADDGIYVTDRTGRIIYANEAIGRILERDPSELVGEPTSIFRSGEMPREYYQRLWNTVLSGHVWRELITNRRLNGELYEASQTITPILDDDGTVTMMVAVQRDLTRHRQLEHEAATSRSELETAVLRRDVMLRELNHRVKNDFLLVASILHLQASRSDVEEIAEELTRAASRVRILGEMYRLFQYPGGDGSVHLPAFLRELENFWRSTILPRHVSIVLEIDDLRIATESAIAIGIIANELVANAIKHGLSGGDGGTVRVRGVHTPDVDLRFTIADDGPGLPAEVLGRERHGLGISVVRSLAEQRGGRLIMQNTPDAGSLVGVEIPLK